jgi:exodeoxyribonuclease VII large subunit
VRAADQRLAELGARLARGARVPIDTGRAALERAAAGLVQSRYQVAAAGLRVTGLLRRLESSSRVRLGTAVGRSDALRLQLRAVASVRLSGAESRMKLLAVRAMRAARADVRRQRANVEGLARMYRQLSPERTLRRGFSITRGEDGKVLRVADEVPAGSRLRTQLAEGEITSRVESR